MEPCRFFQYHHYDLKNLGIVIRFHLEKSLQPWVAFPDPRQKKLADILFVKSVLLGTFNYGEVKRKS